MSVKGKRGVGLFASKFLLKDMLSIVLIKIYHTESMKLYPELSYADAGYLEEFLTLHVAEKS